MDMTETFVSRDLFREGMSLLAAAVNIVTAPSPEGPVGLTASAVCAVTDDPPTLLVCVNTGSSVGAPFALTSSFCVNTIGPAHAPLARLFGGKTPMADRFAAAGWATGRSGSAVLDGALVSFDCRLAERRPFGTHMVLFGHIIDIRVASEPVASAWFGRRFHELRA